MLQRFASLAALVATAVTLTSSAPTTAGSSESSAAGTVKPVTVGDDGEWHFKPVTSVQARVVSKIPSWDAENNAFVSPYGKTFEEKYANEMNSVNTASVEGALKFVQSECINYEQRSEEDKCNRKNGANVVVFYEFQIAQTNFTVAEFDNAPTVEYGPFVAMDSSQCTPEGDEISATCKQINGIDDSKNLGPFVGGEARIDDGRAPYPDCYWFSFPGDCVNQKRGEKTDECLAENKGGLCPFGTAPDGVTCTFSYKILGYSLLDDIVGITSMTSNTTGQVYGNFTEFCNDGGVEFKAADGAKFEDEVSIPFWAKPGDADANTNRSEAMISYYNANLAKATEGVMVELPTVEALVAKNPPCYENDVRCANAAHGCRRHLLAQVCQVCAEDAPECAKAPEGFEFPKLTKAVGPVVSMSSSGSSEIGSSSGETATGSKKDGKDGKDGASTPAAASAATSTVLTNAVVLAAAGVAMALY